MMLSYLKLILILSLAVFTCASSSKAYSMIEEQRADASVGRGRLHPALPVEGDGRSPVIIKIQMPSTAEHILMGQATMMQEMMEVDIEILKLLKDVAKDQEMRDRIDKLITRYEEMLKKHQTIIEKMMR